MGRQTHHSLKAYDEEVQPEGVTAAERGAATRQRILSEAFKLIGEVGWSNVSTRLVAKRAGINAALINYHFRSKDALLRDAASTGMAALVGPAMERMASAPNAGKALAEVLRFLSAELTAEQGRTLLELSMRALDDAEIKRLMVAELDAFRALAAAGITRMGVDPVGAGILLAGALDGVLLHKAVDPTTDVEAAAIALEQLLSPDRPQEERKS